MVVAAFTDDRHIARLYELTGRRLLTLHQVASVRSDVLGRPVRYQPVTERVYAAELAGPGLPADEAAALAGLSDQV